MAKTTETEEGPRNFAALFAQLDGGQVNIDASQYLKELVSQLTEVAERNAGVAKGTLNIAFAFEVASNGHVRVLAKITTKAPRATRNPTAMFLTNGGNLSFENERQQKFSFREVPPAPTVDVSARPNTKDIKH